MATFGVALAEFALDGPIAGTDVVLHDVLNDQSEVLDLSQFGRRPVVEEQGALQDNVAKMAGEAVVSTSVECAVVQPNTVYRTTETEALIIGKGAAVFIVRLPLLDGIDSFPFARDMANMDDLLKKRKGHRSLTDNMGWLACILCDQLDDIVEGAEFGFRSPCKKL